MKVITLLNEKGGVGKTTLSIHIAAGLAISGARVVLMDADPQGSATISLGLNKEPVLHDLFVRDLSWRDALRRVNPSTISDDTVKGDLFVVPTDHSARVIPMMTSDMMVIYNRIQEIRDFADYVIIDTSPTPSLLHAAIYIATDSIIYPTKCEFLSFDGLVNSLQRPKQITSQRPNQKPIDIMGIVPTMYRENVKADAHAIELVTHAYGDAVWEPLTLRTVWTQASFAKRVLFKYAPDHSATSQAWDMVRRVMA